MWFRVNLFPNFEDEGVVNFSLHAQAEGGNLPRIGDFDVNVSGYVPESDSIQELRGQARERAKAILTGLLAALNSD